MSLFLALLLSGCHSDDGDSSNKVPIGPGIDVTETTDPDAQSPLQFPDGVPANIVMISVDTVR